ncbi:arylesterase [Alphaproteobacteria bacterium]|nr:arylesterase [Alphaproteobacteria bacterium]
MKKIIYLVVILFTTSITQAQEFKIILFGDSLMAGYGLEETYHLDRLLQQDLAALNISNQVVNASVSGDTSNGGLNRLAWSLQDNYDLFILGLGANDMLRGLSPETTKANLELIIQLVQEKEIPILLTGMVAPGAYGKDYQNQFNSLYPDLAEQYKLAFYPFLLEGVALKPELNQSDGKHPNQEGIQIISQKLAKKIKKIIN